MKSQILAMEEELTNVVRDQAEFNVQMTEAKSKLTNAVADVTLERRKVLQQTSQISKLQKEIQALHPVLQDPKKLKEAASVLCSKHGASEAAEADTDADSTTQNEVVRQKDYLEKTVLSLKSQLSQVEQQNKSNNLKMFRENKELLREIARLKKEIHDLKQFRVRIL